MRVGLDVKVGADSSKFPVPDSGKGPIGVLDHVAAAGLDGVLFRSILDVSPTLDAHVLADVSAHARDLGLYLEVGIGKCNPFAIPEAPEVRELGEGDYRLAMERMIRSAAEMGVHELWTAMANYKPKLPGVFKFDRFRTDVSWDDQLAATVKFLKLLAPVLRDCGSHLNLETHEEVTSFELVRIVEEVGADCLGITFDTANVVVRGEDPVSAARRVAPYARMSHIRDVAVYFVDEGFTRLLTPCGQGAIDWAELLGVLLEHNPQLNLSIEGVLRSRAEMPVPIHDPVWQAAHPDLSVPELAELVRLARNFEVGAAEGRNPSLQAIREPILADYPATFIAESATYLRYQLATLVPTNPQETSA